MQRVLDDRVDLGLDGLELGGRVERLLEDRAAEQDDRATGFPGFDLVAGAVRVVAHALGVSPGAVGPALEQGGPLAAPRTANRLVRRFVNGTNVVAVDVHSGHSVEGPRLATLGFPAAYEKATSVANWLFSQTNTTGSFQMLAMLSPSWKEPLLTAPSPKNATAT